MQETPIVLLQQMVHIPVDRDSKNLAAERAPRLLGSAELEGVLHA